MGDTSRLRIRKHDPHCLEVVALTEGSAPRVEVSCDLYFFLPKSFATADSFAELRRDFQTRLRLALSEPDGAPRRPIEVAEDEEELRRLVAMAAEGIRMRTRKLKERCRVGLSILTEDKASEEDKSVEELETISRELTHVRNRLQSVSSGHESLCSHGDEYLTHLYGKCLSELFRELARARTHLGVLPWAELPKRLARRSAEEGAYRANRFRRPAEGAEGEAQLHRLTQLKKFFQGAMYLDLERKQTRKRLAEPIAAAGAAVAALWAMYAQRLGSAGEAGSVMLSASVLAYVLKDRLKDRSKVFLQDKTSRWFPDSDHSICIGAKRVGRHREWLEKVEAEDVPESIRLARKSAGMSSMDERIPEQVVRLRWRQWVENESEDGRWAVQTTVRWNVEPFLRHLDEPYKRVSLVRECGAIEEALWHRVYPVYVVADTHSPTPPKAWRCYLDKKGIDRVEKPA